MNPALRWPLAWALLSAACGCSKQTGFERYYPPVGVAQAAIENALTAWQTGLPLITPAGACPVQLDDGSQRRGQRLTAFEILGEVGGDGGRWFEVRLELQEPREIRHERYAVIGIDPLWVMAQEDYNFMTHWDHPEIGASDTTRQATTR